MSGETIQIACVLDATYSDEYALLLAVLIESLAETHRDPRPVTMHVFHDGVTAELRDRVCGTPAARRVNVTWHPLGEAAKARLGALGGERTGSYYIKVLVPELLPPDVQRCVYLDVDLLFLGDVAGLWDTNLGDAIAACCTDTYIRTLIHSKIRPDCDVAGRREFLMSLGLDPELPYFNSGVMVIDVARWRAAAVARRVIEYSTRHPSRNQDQDGLNLVLSGAWCPLDPRWNVFPRLAADFDEPAPDPWVLHFCWYKPTQRDYLTRYVASPSKTAFHRIFHDTLGRTAFAPTAERR